MILGSEVYLLFPHKNLYNTTCRNHGFDDDMQKAGVLLLVYLCFNEYSKKYLRTLFKAHQYMLIKREADSDRVVSARIIATTHSIILIVIVILIANYNKLSSEARKKDVYHSKKKMVVLPLKLEMFM